MKAIVFVTVVSAMVAGGALGAPLEGLRVWAARQKPGEAERMLASRGVTNEAAQASVKAEWDEGALIDAALPVRAYGLLAWAMRDSPFSRSGLDRVKAALLEEAVPVRDALDIVLRYPVVEREEFREALLATIPDRYATTPIFGRLTVEHVVLRGKNLYGSDTPEADLVELLLADEPMSLSTAQMCKDAIKKRAIMLARLQLRAERKSFVTPKDGENPLTAKVDPVVVALNAPGCKGLEAALRALGGEASDCDRTGFVASSEAWREAILSGDLGTSEAGSLLGKVAVALGPDAYNRFIDEYNHGQAAQPPVDSEQ